MERLDFLPDDLKQTPLNRFLFLVDNQFVPTLGRAAAGAAGLLVVLFILQFLLIQRYAIGAAHLKEKRAKVAAEVEKMANTIARLDQRETELSRQIQWQNERIEFLRNYQDPAGRWAPVMREIGQALPPGVWLTELEADPKRNLKIGGGAFEEELVVKFMASLKETPRFRDVAFNFAKKGTVGKTGIVQFEIMAKADTSAVRAP
jgi:Tfp pilus assembly protein PilN